MGRRGFKKAKGQFDDLDSDFKDAIASMSPEEINKRIAEVAKNEQDNLKAKTLDQDLVEKKNLVKEASKQYREATKMNLLRIRFAMQVLSDKGKA